MNPSNYHPQVITPYPANAHVNPNFMWQLHQQAQYVAPRANFVHVNPAFFQPQAPEVPSTKRIIINPKFFPQVQPENIVEKVAPMPVKAPAMPKPTIATTTSKPSPIPHPRGSSDRSKLPRLNFSQVPVNNKYKWRKMDSPSKPASSTKYTLYKLVRRAPALKSPKLSTPLTHRPRYPPSKWLSPPKLTSTPIESTSKGIKSRFKLDNRKKKVVHKSVNKSTVKLTPKPTTPKAQQPARNKSWRPAAMAKWYSQRTPAKSTFTNFKSPLSRSQHVIVPRNGKFQRLVAVIKPAKTVKKPAKTLKTKTRKRYYEDSGPAQEDVQRTLDDSEVEIGVKPSGPKQRTPLGTLPSFITL